MEIQFKTGIMEKASNASAVFIFDDNNNLNARQELITYQKALNLLLENKEFKALPHATLSLKEKNQWLFIIGLGKFDELDPARILEGSALACQMAKKRNIRELDIILPTLRYLLPQDALEEAIVGAQLSNYSQRDYKSDSDELESLKSVNFWSHQIEDEKGIVNKAQIEAKAVLLSRRLGDMPPNHLYPQSFVDEAVKLAKPLNFEIKVYDEKSLAEENMNLIVAVGAGSVKPPRLLTLNYHGTDSSAAPFVLIGKGVTFDSGGMSLKPAGSLEGMKTDMSGAATVLAVSLAVAELQLPINLCTLIPLAENMPSGSGFRVGDVYTARNGRTVEISNTDAEGRLLLADTLSLASEMNAAEIIDVATLTGACVVALGDRCAAIFTQNDNLRNSLMAAAKKSGENFWPLPLLKDYEDLLKSETADMLSAYTVPKGGAINAALFLKRFVSKNIPWAHLDIAGPARASKPRPGTTTGASGFAVRTLIKHLSGKIS